MALQLSKRSRGDFDTDLMRVRRDMDDLFGLFFRGLQRPRQFWPAIDIVEEGNTITVKAEIPGCKAEDFDISVQGNMMTISGEKKETREQKGKGYYHVESTVGQFCREFRLPDEVNEEKVEASYKDGVLTVKMQKSEKQKAAKIKVKQE